jgi:hypothetical protein
MKMSELFAAQLERETASTRRALQNVPEGRNDWKPHEKSMPLGYLAVLIAGMPSWIAMMIEKDELNLVGEGPPSSSWSGGLVDIFDKSVAQARNALSTCTDEHLMTSWRLLVAGRVVDERARHLMIADTFTHLAHHRGQLTVYLRLNDRKVPSIYGPSADERGF